MKTTFTFSFFTKKIASFLGFAIFILLALPTIAQTTATENFENEGLGFNGIFPSTVTQFSQSGINFTLSGRLRVVGSSSLTNGANASHYFVDSYYDGSSPAGGSSLGAITINNPSTAFKVNSFAAYLASDKSGNSNVAGNITFIGTKPDNTTVSAVINVPANPAVQNGITFAGTALNGVYLTSISVSLPASGIQYFELDDLNFTTQAVVLNQFSINDVSLAEGNSGTKAFTFTITETDNTTANSVQVQSASGSATAGSDYVAVPLTTISFTAGGPKTKTIDVTVNGDISVEANETFYLNLTNPVNGVILRAQGVGTILDDDGVIETFEDETPNAQTFSQSGFNFYSNGALMISRGNNIGNTSGTSTSLDTRVGNGGSTGYVGSFGITNAGISFNIAKIDVWTSNNDGVTGTTAPVTVTFIGTKADGTTVSYAAPIAAISGFTFQTINFATTPLANVPLVSIGVTLGAGINYIALDDFTYGTASLAGTQLSINDISVLEGTGGGINTATFTVTRSNNTSTFSVNVASSDGTATAGSDYVAYPSTTINFTNGGPLSQTVNVTILKDANAELNETFFMTLSGATNGAVYLKATGLGTILDDDKLTETFEDETNNATTFSQNTNSFSSSNRLKVINSSGGGSGNSNFYLTSGDNATGGSVGKISVTSANTAFKLIQLDMLTYKGVGNGGQSIAVGPVTFIGTLTNGTTVSTIKTITPTSLSGAGFQKNITFTGTPLDNVLLTSIEFSAGGTITTIDMDNFTYAAFTTIPYIAVTDAANNIITNGATATTTNNTDFGTTCIGSSISKTFTITNTGFSNLTLSGSPLAVIGGTNLSQFSVVTQPATPIAAGASTTFTIIYTPTSAAMHDATITLTNNDITNSPFVIKIKGTANAPVNITTAPVSQVMSGNGSSGSGTAIFAVAATNATYQWQIKNGASYNNLTNATPYSGVTTNTLSIANPSVTLNGAIYRCVLTGTSPCSGANTADVTLTIISPTSTLPSGTLTGTDITTGTDAGWTFYSAGGNVGFAIQWNGNAAAKASAVVSTINGPATSATRNPPGAIYAMARYWNVTTSPAISGNVNIRFYYTAADKSGVTTSAATYAAAHSITNDGFRWFKTVGSAYAPANVTSVNISGNTIILSGTETTVNGVQQTEFDGITSFSGGTGAASAGYPNSLLAVDLLFFKAAKLNNGSVDLSWATASEKSSAYFTLERSVNGTDYTAIATIKSKGTTIDQQSYNFNDGSPNIGVNYYRLSEVSVDGTITRFPLQTVTIAGNQVVKIYPNPIQGNSFYVAIDNAAAVTLKTITGQLVDVSFTKLSNALLAVKVNSVLASGIYLVIIKNASGEEIIQRLLVK